MRGYLTRLPSGLFCSERRFFYFINFFRAFVDGSGDVVLYFWVFSRSEHCQGRLCDRRVGL